MSERHQTQINLPEVGADGQARIKQARVLVIGLGGLGCPTAQYLAAAGVGTIGLADFDTVALSNLHRQILFRATDLGQAKVVVAAERLREMDPGLTIHCHPQGVTAANVRDIIGAYDIVLDCSDNFPTRDLVNAACRRTKPLVSGMALGFEGRLFTMTPDSESCCRCLFPAMPAHAVVQDCARAGVLGAVTGMIGSLQALEALKLILGKGRVAVGSLFVIDGLQGRFREIQVPRDPACMICHENAVYTPFEPREVDVAEFLSFINSEAAAQLIDVRNPSEFTTAHIAGARLITLDDLEHSLETLDSKLPILVYCQAGRRSLAAAEHLMRHGFHDVRSLRGGFMAYQRFQKDIDKS